MRVALLGLALAACAPQPVRYVAPPQAVQAGPAVVNCTSSAPYYGSKDRDIICTERRQPVLPNFGW